MHIKPGIVTSAGQLREFEMKGVKGMQIVKGNFVEAAGYA